MGKLLILSVVVMIWAVVYSSAKYTYQNEDTGQVDDEIDDITRALDVLETEGRGEEAEEEEDDARDVGYSCDCDEGCFWCDDPDIQEDCLTECGFLDRRENEEGIPEKKFIGSLTRGFVRGLRRFRFRRTIRRAPDPFVRFFRRLGKK